VVRWLLHFCVSASGLQSLARPHIAGTTEPRSLSSISIKQCIRFTAVPPPQATSVFLFLTLRLLTRTLSLQVESCERWDGAKAYLKAWRVGDQLEIDTTSLPIARSELVIQDFWSRGLSYVSPFCPSFSSVNGFDSKQLDKDRRSSWVRDE
jgi:hypothetical protein